MKIDKKSDAQRKEPTDAVSKKHDKDKEDKDKKGIDGDIDLIGATGSGVNLEKKEVKKAGDLFTQPPIIKKKTTSESLKRTKRTTHW